MIHDVSTDADDPPAFIANLRVVIQGDGLKELGVFRVPILIEMGGIHHEIRSKNDISAFFKAEKAGRVVVRITMLDEKGKPMENPREFKVIIGPIGPKKMP